MTPGRTSIHWALVLPSISVASPLAHIIGWAMLFYASGNVVLPASYRWHATWWLGDTSRKGGSTSEQRGIAKGQRVWNRQPLGGLSGEGISPAKTLSSVS